MNQAGSPKVSVIITTFNRAGLLPRAVKSALAQTFSNYEVIIVDDCSPDNTQDVIARFTDSRIRSIRHETNKRQSAAINTGIANARGECVAFLDDDDEWLPTKLEKQVEILDSSPPGVGLVYGWVDEIDDSTGRLISSYHETVEGDIFEYTLNLGLPAPTSALLVRSDVCREVGGFDERLTRGNDNDFICRIARQWHAAVVPEVVAKLHIEHGRIRQGDDTEARRLGEVNFLRTHLEKHGDELRRHSLYAHTLRRLAASEMRSGAFGQSLLTVMRSMKSDPVGAPLALLRHRHRVAALCSYVMRRGLKN